jgi:DNA-binding response OmpR family regulator
VGTILVVQADPVLRAEWSEALRHRGHAVLEASDVAAGVAHAREGGIDLVVLDSLDPSRSAKALIDELQRLPEPPPLILVSSSPQAPEQSAHLGAVAFVPKPCAPDDVAAVADSVVSARPRGFEDDEPTGRRRLDDL